MLHSEQVNAIGEALAKAQLLIKQPAKTRTAMIKSEKGSYGYKYADLNAIIDAYRQPFSDNGLSVVQSASTDDRRVAVTTLLLHSSGQWFKDTLFMNVADNRPQAIGSAITYGRRYALSAMVGVAPDDDDDGNDAQGNTPASAAPKKPVAPAAKPRVEPVPFRGPPAHLDAEPVTPVNLYDGSPGMKTAMRKAIAGIKPPIPEQFWEEIEAAMRGRPFKMPELETVISEIRQ